MHTLPARLKTLKGDPWEGYLSTRRSITAKAKKALGRLRLFWPGQQREVAARCLFDPWQEDSGVDFAALTNLLVTFASPIEVQAQAARR